MPRTIGRHRGYALSVFKGSNIESFEVEIVARFRGGGTGGSDIIIGRVSGHPVDEIGGIPLGASGSPVFMDGKLIGAISGTYPPDNYLVTITPIKTMMALASEPILEVCANTGFITNAPPVVVGISSSRALGQLEQTLGRKVVPTPSADSRALTDASSDLRPGSPVGVALMTGDIRVGFIGTTTLVKDGLVYAFGHPVTYAGPVCMPMTSAVVFDTARGSYPFKVGDIGMTIGSVIQDRSSGVLGRAGAKPKGMVKMHLAVSDHDRGATEDVSVRIISLPYQFLGLVFTAIIETYSRSMNRVGQGTSDWSWDAIFTDGHTAGDKGKTATSGDVGYEVAVGVVQALDPLVSEGSPMASLNFKATVKRAIEP